MPTPREELEWTWTIERCGAALCGVVIRDKVIKVASLMPRLMKYVVPTGDWQDGTELTTLTRLIHEATDTLPSIFMSLGLPPGFSNYLFLQADVFMRPSKLLGAAHSGIWGWSSSKETWQVQERDRKTLGLTISRIISRIDRHLRIMVIDYQ